MRLNAVTLTMLGTTRLIDRREPMTVDQISGCIEDQTLFTVLDERLADERFLAALLMDDEATEMLEALQRLANSVLPEKLGVVDRANGFLFLNALFIELIQQNVGEIRFA